eukprot:2824854-Pyramimonas_sp.AAC.1
MATPVDEVLGQTCQKSSERSDNDDSRIHDNNCFMREFFPIDPNRIAQRVADKLGLFDSRAAKPLGKLKVPILFTTLRFPKMMDCEMVVAERKAVQLEDVSHSEPRVVTTEWADVELKHACHLEPEEGQYFLCGEKMQQMSRGRWIQQVVMTRNGNKYFRIDNT